MKTGRKEQFTPGPWRVVANFSRSYVCYGKPEKKDKRYFPPDQCVCCCGVKGEECGDGNNTANGYLIAAAPEMYELLKQLHGALASVPVLQSEIDKILKKARGGA